MTLNQEKICEQRAARRAQRVFMRTACCLLQTASLLLTFSFAEAADSLRNPVTMNTATNTNALPLPATNGLAPVPSEPLVPDALLEEGKMLYESGHYMAALSKFMAVLRQDPTEPVARRYLQRVVDAVQKKPSGGAPGASLGASQASEQEVEQETIQHMRQWALLTMDLEAIPGVQVILKEDRAQVEFPSFLLFADKTGGLKEEGVPILDRIAAWLKSYGNRPIVIHCYPEETEEAVKGGSLFIDRYAGLYGFFVEERGIPPQRFVSAGHLNVPPDAGQSATQTGVTPPAPTGDNASSTPGQPSNAMPRAGEEETSLSSINGPHIVIAILGNHPTSWEGLFTVPGSPPLPRLLELGIMASRTQFSPQDGEWTNLDLAALSRKAMDKWSFKIVPASSGGKEVYSVDGKWNLLRRVSWDGRDQHSGSFVPHGSYLGKLAVTTPDGTQLKREITLTVGHGTVEDVALTQPAADHPAPHKKARTHKPKASPPKEPDKSGEELASTQMASPAGASAASENSPEAASSSGNGGSVRVIWKQVVQFEANDSDLKPTLKASLERIGKTLDVYPLQKVQIVGFAASSEAQAAALAQRRAQLVRNTLVKEYQVPDHKVVVSGSHVIPGTDPGSSKVEMSITN